MLNSEDLVQGREREVAAAAQEVGQMRLSEAGLASEKRDAQGAAIYPAKQFLAEPFVHLGKVHVWKFRHRQ